MTNSIRTVALAASFLASASYAAPVITSSAQTSYTTDGQGNPVNVSDAQLNVPSPNSAFADISSQPDVPGTGTAFQGANGSDAVAVQGDFPNGSSFNTISSVATYSFSDVLTAPDPLQTYRVFLDYSVLPGLVGLEKGLRRNLSSHSEAEISFKVEALGFNADPGPDRGIFAQMSLVDGGGSSIDPGFDAGNPTFGNLTIGNFQYDTIRTSAFTGSANLGQYIAGDTIAFNYILEAHLTQPGFEIFGIAGIGDPLALRVNPGPVSYHLRLEPINVASVPAPASALLVMLGLALTAIGRSRQRAA